MRPFLLFLILSFVTFAQSLQNDLDGDGIIDSDEDINGNGVVDEGETDWKNADTDRGGEADGQERENGRDPFDPTDDLTFDRDNDGLNNGEELAIGTDPDEPDTDRDGVIDGNDPFPIEWRFSLDANKNGIADEWEEAFDIVSADTFGDEDGDGLKNIDEFIWGTNPREPDTDRDGVADGIEVAEGNDPYENACLIYEDRDSDFLDIRNHWSEHFVARLYRTKVLPSREQIIRGYDINNDNLFLPNQQITRFEFLKMVLLSNCIPLMKNIGVLSFEFNDVVTTPRPRESSDRTYKRQVIYTALKHDIARGYNDGSFYPDKSINRAEALKMLLSATHLENPPRGSISFFPDTPGSSWYSTFIERAIWHEIVEGYKDGLFRPDRSLTRAEAAALIYRTMIINPGVNGYVLPSEDL